MARTAGIGVRVEPEVKDAAVKAAEDDHRPVASLVEKLLVAYLRERGYLKAAEQPPETTTPRRPS